MDNSRYGKTSFTRIWITATAVLCILFTFALIPGAAAQSNSTDSLLITEQAQKARKYYSIMQNVFDFIQHYYVDEVDPQVLFEGEMHGMLNALEDPY
jgi:carboxyl-terminal processing protease